MEIIRTGGARNNLNVALFQLFIVLHAKIRITIVIRQEQESLNSARTVLRPLSIHSMWQVQHQSCLNSPLALPHGHEVVNYDLSSIRKIPKLSLPNYQHIWICDRIPILIAAYAILTQVAVTNRDFLGIDGLVKVQFLHVSLLV